jgi:hypothetical protein
MVVQHQPPWVLLGAERNLAFSGAEAHKSWGDGDEGFLAPYADTCDLGQFC